MPSEVLRPHLAALLLGSVSCGRALVRSCWGFAGTWGEFLCCFVSAQVLGCRLRTSGSLTAAVIHRDPMASPCRARALLRVWADGEQSSSSGHSLFTSWPCTWMVVLKPGCFSGSRMEIRAPSRAQTPSSACSGAGSPPCMAELQVGAFPCVSPPPQTSRAVPGAQSFPHSLRGKTPLSDNDVWKSAC